MIKLYLDENIPKAVADGLLLRGYDVLTTYDAGNSGINDKRQLDFARKKGRTIFTFNVRDFIKLHTKYINAHYKHKGIILSKQIPIGKIIKALSKLIMSISEVDIENKVIWLNEFLK